MKKLLITLFFVFFIKEVNWGTDLSTDTKRDDYIPIENKEDSLTIIASAETTQQMQTLTREDIEKSNAVNLVDLLEKKFNLKVTKNGPNGNIAGLSVRGFSTSRVAILIDGVSVNSSQSGDFDLSKIDINSIEKIEIIYGGSDTKYNFSGAIGGVINIITKKKNESGFYIKSKVYNLFYYPDNYYIGYNLNKKKFSKWYDFFDTQNIFFNFGIGSDKVTWDIKLSGEKALNHFIYKDYDDIKRRRINNDIWQTNDSTSLLINLPLYSSLILSSDFYYGNKNIPGVINSDNQGKEIDFFTKNSIYYDVNFIGTDKIDTELTINHTFSRIDWHDNFGHSIHNLNTLNIINKWGFIITNWVTLTIGGDFTYDRLNSTDVGIINLFNGGAYITADFSIKKITKIIPSVKLIYYKKYPIVIPKLGLVFFINQYLLLKNNYFRAFKLPSINDLYWKEDSFAKGNPDLLPEDGIGGDIVLEFKKEKLLSFESSLYVNYIRNAIVWQVGKKGKWSPQNVGEAFYFGSDNRIESDFSKYVTIFASYSFLLSYALTKELTFDSDKRMPYQPIHSFSFGSTFNWSSGNVSISGHYESERYTTIYNVGKLLPYFTLDIDFNQKIKMWTIFASIKNIFNHLYYMVEGYPIPGGSVIIGIKLDIEKKFMKEKREKPLN